VGVEDASGPIVSELVDLTNLDLADLPELDNPVLARSLQKIRDEVEHPQNAAAGFQSSL
jgi:FXSXX-COOH protein